MLWRRRVLTLGAAGLVVVLATGCATPDHRRSAETKEPAQPYLRKTEGTNRVVALEVALRAFGPERGRGPTVWLVGVTHLGTTDYYAQVQRFLDDQSLVLFEGVGATNREFQLHRTGEYSLQEEVGKALGLVFQLNAIRYDRGHFHNSDLTPAQLERVFSGGEPNRPEPLAGPGRVGGPSGNAAGPPRGTRNDELGQLIQMMEGTGLLGGLARLGVSLIAASPRLQATVKIAMIEALSQLPEDLPQMAGLTPGFQRLLRTLIDERNKTVLSDLQAALLARPRPRSIAVFYGAGHMTDLEDRLRAALRYRRLQERWLKAFDVDPERVGLTNWELNFMRQLIRDQMEALRPKPN